MYTKTYQAACTHLVQFGAHGGDTQKGRDLIAKALKELRRIDRKRAIYNRKHMLYISGMFPVKRK